MGRTNSGGKLKRRFGRSVRNAPPREHYPTGNPKSADGGLWPFRAAADESGNPALDQRIETIAAAIDRMSSLIQFSGEDETIGLYALAWQNPGDLVRTGATDVPLGRVRQMKAITPGAEVCADRLLSRIFFNLLDNAFRRGGCITTIRFSVGMSVTHTRSSARTTATGSSRRKGADL